MTGGIMRRLVYFSVVVISSSRHRLDGADCDGSSISDEDSGGFRQGAPR